MSGQKVAVARAHAAIASRLTATAAYLTTSKETKAVEDRLGEIVRARGKMHDEGRPGRPGRLQSVAKPCCAPAWE